MNSMKPKVIITRPESTDGPLSSALRRNSLVPLHAATFAFVPVEDAPTGKEIEDFDWAVWTSANTVDVVKPAPSAATKHVAVGKATASALEKLGITPTLVGCGSSMDIANLIVPQVPAKAKLVYCRSAVADASFPSRLRSAGIDVTERIAYCIGPASSESLLQALEKGAQAIAFASPSAVTGFASIIRHDRELWAQNSGIIIASIGSTTSSALRNHLRSADIVATQPTFPSLAATIARRLEANKRLTPTAQQKET